MVLRFYFRLMLSALFVIWMEMLGIFHFVWSREEKKDFDEEGAF